MIYDSKAKVHNRALSIEGVPLGKIDSSLVTGSKNSVGDIFESWFGKQKDSESAPDLPEAGVELKATPYKLLKNGKTISAKERLVLNIINYNHIVGETFETSHFLFKNKTIELALYEYLPKLPRTEWTISKVVLYEMQKNPADLEIIKEDWETINQYVKEGRAEELTEGATNYLAACTKGKNKSSVRHQPYSSILAKQRAYSLKSGYMTSLMRKYIFGDSFSESIIKDKMQLKSKTLEQIIFERFQPFVGKSLEELRTTFNITTRSKSNLYSLASEMLGLNNSYTNNTSFEQVEEFSKANIMLKTIEFNVKGKNTQSMSFPSFNFKELINETWENDDGTPSASLNTLFSTTKFLFFVVQENRNHEKIFKGVKFFSMPIKDIETKVKEAWEETIKTLKNGVQLEGIYSKNGTIKISNDLVKIADDLIVHVRPHADFSDYTANGRYANELPTPAHWKHRPDDHVKYSDNWMTNLCFFINNSYIREQVKELLY